MRAHEKDNYAKGDILTNIDNIIGSNVSSSSSATDPRMVSDEFMTSSPGIAGMIMS